MSRMKPTRPMEAPRNANSRTPDTRSGPVSEITSTMPRLTAVIPIRTPTVSETTEPIHHLSSGSANARIRRLKVPLARAELTVSSRRGNRRAVACSTAACDCSDPSRDRGVIRRRRKCGTLASAVSTMSKSGSRMSRQRSRVISERSASPNEVGTARWWSRIVSSIAAKMEPSALCRFTVSTRPRSRCSARTSASGGASTTRSSASVVAMSSSFAAAISNVTSPSRMLRSSTPTLPKSIMPSMPSARSIRLPGCRSA